MILINIAWICILVLFGCVVGLYLKNKELEESIIIKDRQVDFWKCGYESVRSLWIRAMKDVSKYQRTRDSSGRFIKGKNSEKV